MSADPLIIHERKKLEVNIAHVKKVRVEAHLGSGGFAEVWKVRDLGTSKYYVLKHVKIRPDVKDKPGLIRRIMNEASVRIPSRYVVECLGLNELSEDDFGMLYEFIPGKDLNEWINDNRGSAWESKKTLFIETLRGVSDAHRMNVIHRDLKPANILVTSENQPKIIDFGLAKLKDRRVTITGELGGTLPYMDPSALLRGIKYLDARCDVYAMGATLYELVMGMHYWLANGLEFEDYVRAVMAGKQNILDLDTAYEFERDPTVENVIRQSTMFDPNKRTRTINEMISALGSSPALEPDIEVDFTIASPVLLVEDGSARGSMNMITVADGGNKRLGRLNLDATNNTISKDHAVIHREGNKYYLYDAGSKNGTFLNGSEVGSGEENKVEIKHTDRIRFGDLWTQFVFLEGSTHTI